MTQDEQRSAIVAEALSWIGTPYRLGAHVKGAGCDCGTFLIESVAAGGVLKPEDVYAAIREEFGGDYSHDWFCHTKVHKYLRLMLRFAKKTIRARCFASEKLLPGSLVMTNVCSDEIGNHGGIVIKWPYIMHCIRDGGVQKVDASRDPMWAGKQVSVFDFWS